MECPRGITRVILVVLDGLRADAIPLFRLPNLTQLAARGARTFAGRTVSPSVTAAAMTSLFTGATPQDHGISSDRWGLPRARKPLSLLPRLLREQDVAVRAFMATIPRAFRGLASRMADHIGVDARFAGDGAYEILNAARESLRRNDRGVTFLHWPDADRAGHASGWTSAAYVRAAQKMDDAIGHLVGITDVEHDPGTVLIAFADHGGGGTDPKDHESSHPLDVTIPIVMAGGQVVTGELAPFTSLLDIPPTVAWALGVQPPSAYAGRVLVEAFEPARPAARHLASHAAMVSPAIT